MTYFWNLHWTSGIAKVKGETLMLNQNKTAAAVRASGKFDDLVAQDVAGPGDAGLARQRDQQGRPAQRELRARADGALHARASDNYTQTGRHRGRAGPDGLDASANYNRATNYNAATFAGPRRRSTTTASRRSSGRPATGTAYDAIGIILDRTDCRGLGARAASSARKLWSFFAGYATAPDFVVDAARSRSTPSSGHSIREVVRAILLHAEFYAPHARQDLGPQPGRVRRRRGADARGHDRLFGAANALAGHGPGPLQSRPTPRAGTGASRG